MKKILLIATIAASLSGLSAFGQGNFIFTGPVRGSWDLFNTGSVGTPRLAATMNVALVIGTGPALIDAIASSTLTNGTSSGLFTSGAQLTAMWNAILNDPNFSVAIDTTVPGAAVATTAANSGWSYRTGATFPVQGTSSAGGTVQAYVIGWDKNFATPALAAAGNSALGWSQVFSYTYAAFPIGTPGATAPQVVPFGVYSVVPEPTTFALAGLCGAAMLIIRRRK